MSVANLLPQQVKIAAQLVPVVVVVGGNGLPDCKYLYTRSQAQQIAPQIKTVTLTESAEDCNSPNRLQFPLSV